ncbi:MAG: glutathione S-transferase N-terminal domain-containing protein [Pseudomonadota bacterium]
MTDQTRLSLYWFRGCPWCERVRAAIADLGLEVDERNIREHAEHAAAMHEATGRGTVPVLRIDTDNGTEWVGESADIVRRLYADYGGEKPTTFFASKRPQRLGMIGGGALLITAFFVPEDAQRWVFLAAGLVWLLGTRAPLLRRWFQRSPTD